MQPFNTEFPHNSYDFFTMHTKTSWPICPISGTTPPNHGVSLFITFHILCIDRFVFRILHLYILILVLVRAIMFLNLSVILILIVLSPFGIGILYDFGVSIPPRSQGL